MKTRYIAVSVLLGATSIASADSRTGLSLVPYVGYSELGNQSAVLSNLASGNGASRVEIDPGFTAGLALRYHFDSPFSSEFGWEYRSNDSVIVDNAGVRLPSGNYASSVFYFSGRYDLPFASGRFQPWLGTGLSIVQEVDLDSESTAGEISFSDSGSIGYQLMAGVDIELTPAWYLSTELRYSDQRDLTLEQEEGGGGVVADIDYQPLTLSFGLGYRF
jgi:opacity protein-like surface antigen